MDWHEKSIRMGATVIALAVVLRLYGTGALASATEALGSDLAAPILLYLESGRVVHPVPSTEPTSPVPETTVPPETKPALVFTPADAELVQVRGTMADQVDVAALLARELDLDLAGEAPTVLILHTHATESYTQAYDGEYTASANYRTLDTDHNLVAIGARVTELLEAAGIRVLHAQDLHDYPDYNEGYPRSRTTAETILAQNPQIRLVLDLHRDSAANDAGQELDTSAQKDGQESAQLMALLSPNHEAWQENMALAVQLTAVLERNWPGITRGILTRNNHYHYNQDLSPGALLIEVGAAGNTRQEALVAAEALAQAIIALSSS